MTRIRAVTAIGALLFASVMALESPLSASAITAGSTSTSIHIVDKAQHIAFELPKGFVHEAVSKYLIENLWDHELSVAVYLQNPAGEVTTADEETYVSGWLQNTDLQIRKSNYVHKRFGSVARTEFTFQPSNEPVPFFGWDLRFIDGLRSFEVIVEAPAEGAVSRIANAILSSWGK